MDVWFAQRGADLSPASLAVLRQLLIDAMGHLGSGFGSPTPTPTTAAPTTHLKERL
jgi:hypothetical protein